MDILAQRLHFVHLFCICGEFRSTHNFLLDWKRCSELKQFYMFPNIELLLSVKDNVYRVLIFHLTLFKDFVLKVKDWPVVLLYSIIAKFYVMYI